MRVLMLSWEYPPNVSGGMGEHVRRLVPALLQADPALELHVLAPGFGDEPVWEGLGHLAVHRVPVIRPQGDGFYSDVCLANEHLLAKAQQLASDAGGFDLVHVHDWHLGITALSLGQEAGLPLLSTIHATERGRLRNNLHSELQRAIDAAEHRLANRSARIIVCSTAMVEEVTRYFGVPATAISMIPNAVDGSHFDALSEPELATFRDRYARPDEHLVFFIGRLVYEKGADLLIEAAPRVINRMPGTRFVLGGTGPLLDSLRGRVSELGLSDRVALAGYISNEERDRLYKVADCCVFPSRYEPFGIVALEAMAAGTPVVVSDVNGLATVVSHEETGITVYPDNVESLAWGILHTLRDPAGAARRSAAALRVVREGFSWPRVAAQTMGVYERIAARAF